MSEPTRTLPKPGWYPDPAGSGRRRWWTGLGWSDRFAEPGQIGGLSRNGSTSSESVYGEWIWLVVVLPYVPSLGLFFIDWDRFIAMLTSPNPDVATLAGVQLILDPAYLFLIIGAWVAYFLVIAFAAADRARLRRLGVERPFHWSVAIFSATIYVVGRSIVVNRRAGGGGLAPIWLLLALLVASSIAGALFGLWFGRELFETVSAVYG
ncbi:DUF2510 domain-containing protein [Agromyces sp. SYSU T00194]|uniref:DUF2510 domain-containing protein n=1 Tax=Agromyces chitinivorans TaxID=3158560 RepID=UPI00339A78C4